MHFFSQFKTKPFAKLIKKPELNLANYNKAVIVHWGENPTVDYYFKNRTIFNINICIFLDLTKNQNPPSLDNQTIIIIVRYMDSSIVQWLINHKRHGCGLIFFMDDDLPENMYDTTLPWRYRLRLWNLFGKHLKKIEMLADELWVSTPTLYQLYADIRNIRQIQPQALQIESSKHKKSIVTYFYHGSPSTHRQDIEWLTEVVRITQNNSESLVFMIVGDKQVRQQFSKQPRTIILHPMQWSTYRDNLSVISHHIGLAPLLNTKFNNTRSPSRFFDFTRLDAVGLYSNSPPYCHFIQDGIDGYLLPNDPSEWSKKIIELANNPQIRLEILNNAKQRNNEKY
ncbi:MAG: hypothetical protein RI964_1244 [Pseudomonadota bacterium]|jgi:hypothetical protein